MDDQGKRTQTRWGKFRPYNIFGVVPCVVFYTPNLSHTGKVIWAFAHTFPWG